MTLRVKNESFDAPVSAISASLSVVMGQNTISMFIDEDDYDKLDEATREAYDEPLIFVTITNLNRGLYEDDDLLDAFGSIIEHPRTYTVEMDNLLDLAKDWCDECDGYGVTEVDATCNKCGSVFMAQCPECGERQGDGSLKPDYCECEFQKDERRRMAQVNDVAQDVECPECGSPRLESREKIHRERQIMGLDEEGYIVSGEETPQIEDMEIWCLDCDKHVGNHESDVAVDESEKE